MKFTHLHTHSHYSLLDGLTKIDPMVARAKELGMDSIALTDHGNLYGAVEFYQKARKAGIKPIIGCELYIAARGMADKDPAFDQRRFHLTVIARNAEGYHNLIKLVTAAHLRGFYYKPRVDRALLRQFAGGLTALSGCLTGEIPRAIQANNIERAEELIREYQEIFGKEYFYLELGAHPNIPEQLTVNRALQELSQKTGAGVVATNDIHYCRAEDAEAQDILVSVQTGARFEDENRLTMKQDNFSLRSADEMASIFPSHPAAIENSMLIADSTDLSIELGKNKIPPFPAPSGYTQEQYLESLCLTGIEKRYHIRPADLDKSPDPYVKTIRERFRYESDVIKNTGFVSYFLVVQDFVNWARQQGIIVGPGRGSAAGSLISYVLHITNIDPIHYNLLFERFLNPERISMPDIDLDFADTRRDEVIEYVQKKYGNDHVAQIITFGTMAARAAIRDTGRALGMPYNFCDQLAKLIPFNPTQGMKEGWLSQCLKEVQELKNMYQQNPDAKRLIDSALKLEGVVRHASIHASGVVIAPEPLDRFVPLQYATRSQDAAADENKEVLVTQYDMHGIEALGLLKMDFLGLRNLSIIERTVNLVEKLRGEKIDIDALALDDKEAFKIFQEAKTTGVFQMESAGMKRYLKELKPTELEDLIAMVALYRPGPMEYLPAYIKRKHKLERVTYLHPKLEPILSPTYGIGVYQEQMMQIARDLAGFTLPEADTLRKAIGKKIKSLLNEQHDKLVAGMIKNGIRPNIAEEIWELFPAFARYGFNRSHAACYALVAYQTGYLKAHYPAEYMASLMTAEGFEIERVAFLIDEAKTMGLEVLPPDVNESFETFTVISASAENNAAKIRFGLSAIKNVGSNIVDAIIAARKLGGKFKSLADFIERIPVKDLNRKSVEALAKCGALDVIAERNEILGNMDLLLGYARDIDKKQSSNQSSLFGGAGGAGVTAILRLAPTEPATKKERLAWEKELLGLYVTEHPMQALAEKLKDKVTPMNKLDVSVLRGRTVAIGGIVSIVKKILTKSGAPMLFVTMEDATAKTEVLVFPSVLEKNPSIWQADRILLVKGKLSDKDGEPKILCDQVSEIL
ncbi:MAG: polymerase III catalytic subunit, DnaE type protein [Parcubacteria group bacterium GW2011_GWA1_51_12]|nr:MAG: polymerase III catalytic subunit, DnaE type protein [Parcubacteria group bacterium GW2011_GWA1_51_12]